MLSRKAAHDRMRDHVSNTDTSVDPSKSKLSEDTMVTSDPTEKAPSDPIFAEKKATTLPTAKRTAPHQVEPPAKRKAQNFLLMGAKKAKAARSARTAARVGCFEKSSKHNKLSNTGSGALLSQVVRLKYVKGFTQAVSTPCQLEDLA
jgi:chromosome transmission fidelity protein 18